MKCQRSLETSLYLDVLHTLEDIGAHYAIIGAFGASLYGVTRVTYDIDMLVNLTEDIKQALAAAESALAPRGFSERRRCGTLLLQTFSPILPDQGAGR